MGLIYNRIPDYNWVVLPISSPNNNPTNRGFHSLITANRFLPDHDLTTETRLWIHNFPPPIPNCKESKKKLSTLPRELKSIELKDRLGKVFFSNQKFALSTIFTWGDCRVWCHHRHWLTTSPTGLGPPTAYSSPVARRLHTSECTACWGAETKWYILSAKTRFTKMMHATSCNSSNVLILNGLTWWHVLFCIGIYVELTWKQVESYMPHLANIHFAWDLHHFPMILEKYWWRAGDPKKTWWWDPKNRYPNLALRVANTWAATPVSMPSVWDNTKGPFAQR